MLATSLEERCDEFEEIRQIRARDGRLRCRHDAQQGGIDARRGKKRVAGNTKRQRGVAIYPNAEGGKAPRTGRRHNPLRDLLLDDQVDPPGRRSLLEKMDKECSSQVVGNVSGHAIRWLIEAGDRRSKDVAFDDAHIADATQGELQRPDAGRVDLDRGDRAAASSELNRERPDAGANLDQLILLGDLQRLDQPIELGTVGKEVLP